MLRNVSALEDREHDLIIIGGGIFGVCAAWDAALRGLAVAIVERGDFAGATSANSYKIVHGGIRYVQHLDLVRIRSSCRERSALLRIAPHLVQPLPIVIPTYGHGKRGKTLLSLGFLVYDLLTVNANRGIQDPMRRIPRARFVSRDEILGLFPGLNTEGLTGGAIFYDGQIYNPPRLAMSFLRSAVNAGVIAANYVEAIGFLRSGDRVTGIDARDTLTGERFSVRGKFVLNAAGPWAEPLLERLDLKRTPGGVYSRDACFVVHQRLSPDLALAVQGRTKDPDAILSRAARHLFLVPWRDYTLIGVWHVVHSGGPDDFTVTQTELRNFIGEINEAYPTLDLKVDDVLTWNAGLVPFGENKPGQVDLSYGKRSQIIDHLTTNGVDGLVTLIGVRYTMARGDAARAIELIARRLGGRKGRQPATDKIPIYGGQIANFEEFFKRALSESSPPLNSRVVRALVHNHGSEYKKVLAYGREQPSLLTTIDGSDVLKAEVVNAARQEMALKLEDVVFRRTELGTGENPGATTLSACAELMASELGWNDERVARELNDVRKAFRCRSN